MFVLKSRAYEKKFTSVLNDTICRPKQEISDAAYRVHLVLLSTCPAFHPNERWLAKTLGKSISSIQKSVRELKSLGLLKIYQKWEDIEGKFRTMWVVSETPCDLPELASMSDEPP